MDTPRHPKQILADIWEEFHKARYEDNQEIIEYLAYLMSRDVSAHDTNLRLNRPQFSSNEDEETAQNLSIEKPKARYGVSEVAVLQLLNDARKISGGWGTFFDHYILFYQTKIWQKETYPIPRHIVDFMLALLQIAPDHSFADFACRQGGFLVARNAWGDKGQSLGVESSFKLAQLAHANAQLHDWGRPYTKVKQGDAFEVCAKKGRKSEFDRIAMAPPFGGTVNATSAKDLFPGITDYAQSHLFTRLALRQLKEEGQAALLVPDGLLHNGGASRQLRAELIDEYTVKAVVTLQAGIFQPYVATPMYLLLFQKGHATQHLPTWFIRIANDGYPLNVGRDLTTEPSQNSELPLARAVILSLADKQTSFQVLLNEQSATEYGGQPLFYKSLTANLSGAIFQVQPGASLDSMHYLSVGANDHYLVIQARLHEKPVYITISFSHGNVDAAKIRTHLNLTRWKRTLFPSARDEELPDGRYIFGRGVPGQSIAITQEGRLLGFTKTREEISKADYQFSDIHWNQHATLPPETIDTAEMLQQMRTNQRLINDYAESLQGQLAVKHLLAQTLPPKLLDVDQLPLLSVLGKEQQHIWNEVRQLVTSDEQTDTTASHFRPEDLPQYAKEPVKVQQTLQLLECLGLIVQVALADSTRYYRRVTELDQPEDTTLNLNPISPENTSTELFSPESE